MAMTGFYTYPELTSAPDEWPVVSLYIADNWSGPVWSCPHRVTKAVTGSYMGGLGPD
jgi:hypothetical protein